MMLLRTFSWQELRHHPWRNAAAMVAVMLGVALAFSVQLINASALDEFSSAVRSVNGQPDLELRAVQGSFDEATLRPGGRAAAGAHWRARCSKTQALAVNEGKRISMRVIGVDALVLPTIAPSLMPVPSAQADRFAILAPGQVFLNAAAQSAVGASARSIDIQSGSAQQVLKVAGSVAAGGGPLAVMDIGAAQDLLRRGKAS